MLCLLTVPCLMLPLLLLPGSPAVAKARERGYHLRTLHFKVQIGADGGTTCDVVGDLYTPRSASSHRRFPALLTTNGFGGSKDDQAGIGRYGATHGYVVLSYSGLGFGGSGCKITLDDPDTDGRAASQLVSYLGGARGIAFTDAAHTRPAPRLRVVRRDHHDHAGRHRTHDPRVGMIGGSYGGEIQFAAASVDPRIDTIVPVITWNDLSYSLGPNNTDQQRGVSSPTPGAIKLTWGLGFSALGMADGLQNAKGDPSRLLPCPNFATFVCPALVTGGATGFFQPGAVSALRHASVVTYMKRIRIPTLLLQGQADTLFNLNEAAATYRALRRQGTPVKMIWQSWGHSDSTPAPGEIDLAAPDPATQYETRRVFRWFARHLEGRRIGTGPRFAWFRDWVRYRGIATPAYAHADHFPVGRRTSFHLSGADSLVRRAERMQRGTASFVTPAAGVPTRLEQLDAVGAMFTLPVPEQDLPGSFAAWTTGRLRHHLDVVGIPRLRLRVQAPLAAVSQSLGNPAGDLVLFVRLQDVGPGGTARDIEGLTAPVRVPDTTRAFDVKLPAIVHRFAKGHRLRLVVAGGSLNYRGGLVATPVRISTGSKGQVLSLPVTR